MPSYKAPRGAPDLVPPRSEQMQQIVRTFEDLARAYGFRRIETPIFEHAELFERGLDEGSDLVNKEMYKFQDRSGRWLALRPEGTAPVLRAVLEHGLHNGQLPVKLSYTAPSFRYERPQRGRYRALLQLGVEAIGSPGPEIDAEVIELGSRFFERAGVSPQLHLNSIGHPECRASYMPKLKEFLEARRDELCDDCRRKIETNPLRTFDCKVPSDREIMAAAPLITDHLCGDCSNHFGQVQDLLKESGVEFELDKRLVRGLDYYTRTTFAWVIPSLGAQNEVGGGGRYDGLSELLGGPSLPGIGFGLGADRTLLAIEQTGAPEDGSLDAFIAHTSEAGRREARRLASALRAQGIRTELDHDSRKVSAQFKAADRLGVRWVVVIGEREIESGTFTVRDMDSGDETAVAEADLAGLLRN